MASRTYLPQMVYILHRICVYITRYRATILDNLPTGGAAALDAVILACEALIALADIPHGD
jgi:hypothetical protein